MRTGRSRLLTFACLLVAAILIGFVAARAPAQAAAARFIAQEGACERHTRSYGGEAGLEVASSSLRACRAASVFGKSLAMDSSSSLAFRGDPVSRKR